MTVENARQLTPLWTEKDNVKVYRPEDKKQKNQKKNVRFFDPERFTRQYGILLICAAAFCIYSICLCAFVHYRTEKAVRREMAIEYSAQLEAYKAEQKQAEQASYFLSGDASREAAINQEVDAVAQVISKLSTDAQKATEACCMLARVMNQSYPNSFAEVAQQPLQWMFYDGTDKTFSQHDREIAESIVRPYMEEGIVPNGLTSAMVYGAWSTNDFVLRDSYQNTSTMHTWRYQ